MPLRYWYSCDRCERRGYGYRNFNRCPKCSGNLIRDNGRKPRHEARQERSFTLVTNDDGFGSDGLWAAVEAVLALGEVLVVAPNRPWSRAGRSMPPHVTGRLEHETIQIEGHAVRACDVDAGPAVAVVHGVVELAARRTSLVVSGIDYGANLGIEAIVKDGVLRLHLPNITEARRRTIAIKADT